MKLFDFVLFLHIAAAIFAAMLGGSLIVNAHLMKRADSVAQLRILVKALKLGPFFGLFDLLLLLLGIWLVQLSKASDDFSFGTPFVWTGIVGIAILLAIGPTILEPFAKRSNEAAESAPDGPVSLELRGNLLPAKEMVVVHGATGLFLAVIFNMATKPDVVGAVAALVVGTVVGGALALPVLRPAKVVAVTEVTRS